ncbi:DNA adenine methylase [Candidatus Woesearchaeota archaeon]|nr:DNA adenine methylase [Candidatus Woesearchaeota archaeon]
MRIPKFVKWAGGKIQLLEQLEPLFPEKITRYHEPFVGSGAVFFFIMKKYKPKEAFISDANEELITTYLIIRDKVEELIKKLQEHKKNYFENPKEYFYHVRSIQPKDLSPLERAARFIFLNRTCFNGLYRENRKGEFNVPMGDYKNPTIVQEETLREAAKLLQGVTINTRPFQKVVEEVKKRDFVYFDPPYYPLDNSKKGNKSFTSYLKDKFLEKEQELLKKSFVELDKKSCLVMESNSDTEYIKILYKEYKISIVQARRSINSNAKGRGSINEVVIINY